MKKYSLSLKDQLGYVSLSLAFAFSSLGLPFNKIIAFSLITIFLATRLPLKKLSQDKVLILTLLFLGFSLMSAFLGENVISSATTIGWLVLLVGVLFYTGSHIIIIKRLPPLLIIGGFVLCGYSLLVILLKTSFLIPKDGYQLVFSRFGSHNHLGDFLILPMLVCLYSTIKKQKWVYALPLLFFLPFFLLSYSRSAYLSFFIVGFGFLIHQFWKSRHKLKWIMPLILSTLSSVVIGIFFLSTVFESKFIPVLNPIHQVLINDFGLRFKHFGANRPEYWRTAIESIREKPFFGVGPGNFVYASAKYSKIPNYRTHSSHNIFLDVFVEYGLFAFICFVILMTIIARTAIKTPSVYSLLFFALLVNFQTDYTFRIASLGLLFFLIMSIINRIRGYEV